MCSIRLFFIFFITLCTFIHTQRSLAEALEYSPTDKVVILNADDFGMCHSENIGTFKVLEYGLINSATLMVPCPWALEAVEYIKSKQLKNIGVHVTLTSEMRGYRWRPTNLTEPNSLVDEQGYMWRTGHESEKYASIQDVFKEIKSQLDIAQQKWGLNLSHFDSHMGTLYGATTLRFELLALAFSISYEYGLPFRLPYLPFFEGFRKEGFAILDYLIFGQINVPREFEARKQWYLSLFRRIQPGVTEIFIHPAVESEELKHITGEYWIERVNDMKIFLDDEVRKFIQDQNIILIDFNKLKEYQRKKMNWRPGLRAMDVFDKYKKMLWQAFSKHGNVEDFFSAFNRSSTKI